MDDAESKLYARKLVELQNMVKKMYEEQGLVPLKSVTKTKMDCIILLTKKVKLPQRVNKPKVSDLTPLDEKYHELGIKNPDFKDYGRAYRVTDGLAESEGKSRYLYKFVYLKSIYNNLFTGWKLSDGMYLNIDTGKNIKPEKIDKYPYYNSFFKLVSFSKELIETYIKVLMKYFDWIKSVIIEHLGTPGYVMLESKVKFESPIKMMISNRTTPHVDEKYAVASSNKKLFDMVLGYINNKWSADYDVINMTIKDDSKNSLSSGEKIMNKMLTDMGISLLANPGYFRLNTLKSKRFDFAFEYKKQKIIIEIDGAQHFKPVELFGGEEAFEERMFSDIIKTQEAIKAGFKMIRFSKLDEVSLKKNLVIALGNNNKFWCDHVEKYQYIITQL
jgi:very-short-patch-repair endonuclease